MRMGPEALMVRARTTPLGDVGELARLEYAYEDVRVLAACLGPEASDDPVERSAVGGLVLRAHEWLRERVARVAMEPAEGAEAPEDGEPAALWAIPLLGPRRTERAP